MTPTSVKAGLLLVGLVTWFWGYRADDPAVRWLGIAFVGVAFLLRFVRPKRRPRREEDSASGPGETPS